MTRAASHPLAPYFVGSHSENAGLFEELLVDHLRDHLYWRRHFHPEDPSAVHPADRHSAASLEFESRLRHELSNLSADLKRSVPWFSPRYLGHMASDLLLPGLLANLITTLYNPNNVSEDAAPSTVAMEVEVGLMLARMVGFAVDEGVEGSAAPRAYGHLCSGGTLANYEGLRNAMASRFYPLAVQSACTSLPVALRRGDAVAQLLQRDAFELSNLDLASVISLQRSVFGEIYEAGGNEAGDSFDREVRRNRCEVLGLAEFLQRHQLRAPKVCLPRTAHYSWEKAMQLLGLGSGQLRWIEADGQMRMKTDCLEATLDELWDSRETVLNVVGILGTTEFGTIDPIGEIVELRKRLRERGQHFEIHVDGAWGGFLSSIFRKKDGELRRWPEVASEFRYFPSKGIYDAFAALSEVDSITIDPHKLGYLAYPAGAFVAKDRRIVDFVSHRAPYVFDDQAAGTIDLHRIGQYVLEGSKPGAAAAATYTTYRVLPLHHAGFGSIVSECIRVSEDFVDTIRDVARELEDELHLCIPFEPDTNLLCIAVNPKGNRDVEAQNRFALRFYKEMAVDRHSPTQVRPFFASKTSVGLARLGEAQRRDFLAALHLPNEAACEPGAHVILLRHTLMNPWLAGPTGKRLVEDYRRFFVDTARRLLASFPE